MRKLTLGALTVVATMATCSTAQAGVLGSSAKHSVASTTVSARMWVTPPKFQRGIGIDAYTYTGQDIAAAAAADVAYIKKLDANSVSISFPFFMTSRYGWGVFANKYTPKPAQLATLVHDARQAGLYVTLRPLLDETNLKESRTVFTPAHLAAWFSSYQKFLVPYAKMAQAQHVGTFIVGTELSRFASNYRWNSLDNALRTVYSGTLAFANNWDVTGSWAGDGGKGVTESVDAYHPQSVPLLAGWEAWDNTLPTGTVESEVGIDAVKGAYKRPWQHHWNVTSLDLYVQKYWFTAACKAAAATHLGGIYFWPLQFGTSLTGPTLTDQGYWANSLGAQAISTCYASLGG